MSELKLETASRKKARIRLGLSAVAGGGKTYSALLIAKGLVGDYKRVAIIDTENGSAHLYSHLGRYKTVTLRAPFSPERYIQAIDLCEASDEVECIIIDSISHEWVGEGGCLWSVEQLGGRATDWKTVSPRHQRFVDRILQSRCHVITTVRRKQDYQFDRDKEGKFRVQKGGLAEITREGFEYELTTNLEMDQNHFATASKDRTGLFMGLPAFIPSVETGKAIRKWCNKGGVEVEDPKPAAPPAPEPPKLDTAGEGGQKTCPDALFVKLLARLREEGKVDKKKQTSTFSAALVNYTFTEKQQAQLNGIMNPEPKKTTATTA